MTPATAWAACTSAEQVSEEEQLALVYGDRITVSIATGGRDFLTNRFSGMIGNPRRYEGQTRRSVHAAYADAAGHNRRFGQGRGRLKTARTAIRKNDLLKAAGVPIATA